MKRLLTHFFLAALLLISQLSFAQSRSTRIIGGQDATIEEYPHQVALMNGDGTAQFCGGSIIDSQTILTASHCLTNKGASEVSVAYAVDVLMQGIPTRIAVSEIIMHPQYDRNTQENDIAILKLAEKIILSDKAKIIPIVTKADENAGMIDAGTMATVSGWGNTSADGNFVSPDVLQKVQVPIVTNAVANGPTSYNGQISEDMMCAGVMGVGGTDACQGDSGGPFVVEDGDGNFKLAGVVSWGYGCADPNYPGVYAKVSHFEQWIYDNTDLEGVVDTTTTDGGDSDTTSAGGGDNTAPEEWKDCDFTREVTNVTGVSIVETMADVQNNTSGHIAGNNGYGDIGIYEQFINAGDIYLSGFEFNFGIAEDGGHGTNITFNVYGDDGANLPDVSNLIHSVEVPLTDIVADVAANRATSVDFGQGVHIEGNYYIGFIISYSNGDQLVAKTFEGTTNHAIAQLFQQNQYVFWPFNIENMYTNDDYIVNRSIDVTATLCGFGEEDTTDTDTAVVTPVDTTIASGTDTTVSTGTDTIVTGGVDTTISSGVDTTVNTGSDTTLTGNTDTTVSSTTDTIISGSSDTITSANSDTVIINNTDTVVINNDTVITVTDTITINNIDTIVITQTDTVTIENNDTITIVQTDTITIDKNDTIIINHYDTLEIVVNDTITITETVETPCDWETIFIITLDGDTVEVNNDKYIDLSDYIDGKDDEDDNIDDGEGIPTHVIDNETIGISVYPNPTTDMIRFTGIDYADGIRVYNEAGQLMTSSRLVESIDVSRLANGLYFIEVESNGSFTKHSFVKE